MTSPGGAKVHSGARPPWTGGYQSFTPSTPGFPGYVGENRVVPPAAALAGLRPAASSSITYDVNARTFDCDASLTDTQASLTHFPLRAPLAQTLKTLRRPPTTRDGHAGA